MTEAELINLVLNLRKEKENLNDLIDNSYQINWAFPEMGTMKMRVFNYFVIQSISISF